MCLRLKRCIGTRCRWLCWKRSLVWRNATAKVRTRLVWLSWWTRCLCETGRNTATNGRLLTEGVRWSCGHSSAARTRIDLQTIDTPISLLEGSRIVLHKVLTACSLCTTGLICAPYVRGPVSTEPVVGQHMKTLSKTGLVLTSCQRQFAAVSRTGRHCIHSRRSVRVVCPTRLEQVYQT